MSINKSQFDQIIARENTNCVQFDARKVVFGSEEVLPMWVADMNFAAPQVILDVITQRCQHGIFGYGIKSDSWYQSIIEWLSHRHQWNIEQSWINFCPGVVPSFNMAVELYTNPGDGVIIQTPVYPPFISAVEGRGRKLLNNQLIKTDEGYRIDFEDFKLKAKEAKLFILCSPHNPVGRVWTRNELEQLATICLENNVLVVSDEIHADLVFKPHKHIAFATLSDEIANNCITLVAPSKTFNIAGLAASVAIIPNTTLRTKYKNWLASYHLDGGNILGIAALEAAFRHGEPWLNELLIYVEENFDLLQKGLKEHVPTIKMHKPEGTYLVWLDFTQTKLPHAEIKRLLIEKAKLGINDGLTFGLGGENHMRINLAYPRTFVAEALERLTRTFA